jgi:hypothetical protein
MTYYEELYLILVIAAFVALSVSLAGVMLVEHRHEHPKPSRDQKLDWSHQA